MPPKTFARNSGQSLLQLTERKDFLAVQAKNRKEVRPAFILQIHNRRDDAPPRIGFTASQKVGNAIKRNRAKRRMRELARRHAALFKPGHDYVLIAREAILTAVFTAMDQDLKECLTARA